MFRGTRTFFENDFSDYVYDNLKSYWQNSLLGNGAYYEIAFGLPTSGYTVANSVDNLEYDLFGPSIIWQSGVGLAPSGVWVDGIFHNTATASGQYEHYFDYEKAKVFFSNAQSGVVQVEYAIPAVDVITTNDDKWPRISESFIENYANGTPSGILESLKDKQVWDTTLVIDLTSINEPEPLQMGGGEIDHTTITYHIFSYHRFQRNKLIDLIRNQDNQTIKLFDINEDFNYKPLYDGTIASGTLTFDQAGDQYFWTKAYFEETNIDSISVEYRIHRAMARTTLRVYRYIYTY
jgi:hypothetical protein